MKEIVDRFRGYIVYIGLLSLLLDLLMLTPPIFMLSVFDKVLTSRSTITLIVLLGLALYALLMMALLDLLRTRLLSRFSAALKRDLAPRVMEINLRHLNQSEAAQHGLDDVNELEAFLTGPGIKAFFEAPWIPLFLVILYLFHPLLAVAALVPTLLLLLLTVAEDRFAAGNQKRATELSRRASSFAFLARQNAETIGPLGMQSAMTDRWRRLNDDALEHSARAGRVTARTQAASRFVRVSGQMIGLSVGALLMLNVPDVSAGIMMAAVIIMGRAMSPIEHLIGAWKSFVGARSAYARLSKLLADAVAQEAPSVRLPRPLGELLVDRVFLHLSREQRILSGIHFKLGAGESLGIIGPSGTGKTTLARLMVGLLKPTQGHVRLDGADVYLWAQSDLGQYIGYLPQEVILFPGTVAENIARMQAPEDLTDAVIEAAKQAHAHEMILKLPKGYATLVGEGGNRLSGGQRQLVGLARALFGNPSLVILDEPNANLDSLAEAALIDVIRELKDRAVTLAIITHKPSIVRDVDHLLVLRGGEQNVFGKNQDVLRVMNAGQRKKLPATNTPPAITDQTAQRLPDVEEAH